MVERAMGLAEAHGLRAYDEVQLAAALELNALLVGGGLPPLVLISNEANASRYRLSIRSPRNFASLIWLE